MEKHVYFKPTNGLCRVCSKVYADENHYKIALPTVHLNGTSQSELVMQVGNAFDALRYAIEKFNGAEPNGRDYYPQGADALQVAVDEHVARLEKLQSVLTDLQEQAEYLVQFEKRES